MKCYVCGEEIPEGYTECKRCGFPMFAKLGQSAEMDASIHAMVRQYLLEKIKNLRVGIKTYSWKTENDQLVQEAEFDLLLASCGELTPDAVQWAEETFVHTRLESVDLTMFVRREDGSTQTRTVPMGMPAGDSEMQVGIRKDAEGMLVLCLGTPESYTTSDPINIL